MIITPDFSPNLSKLTSACKAAEQVLAMQVMKDTRPYVPALTMSLNQRTHTVGKNIVYPGPYARYVYMGVAMVDSKTGKGPMKIPEVGYRFHKGATLVPTSRPLHYTKTVHPLATDHWMDYSIEVNRSKWESVGRKAVAQYGK